MAILFDVVEDKNNNILFITNAEGNDVIRAPLMNKGTAFTKNERDLFKLHGLLPPRILTIDQHIEKVYQKYTGLGKALEMCRHCREFDAKNFTELKKEVDISRYNFLRELQDRNEVLFYGFAYKYMKEVIPIIYTPTVGDAVLRYSRDSARFRGIFLSPFNIDGVDSVFDQFRFKKPTIAVVTDNQGILGLGDQGVGGIDIPIGKLALYVIGAGIRPWETMPITLDVGTDNPDDLKDSYYLGYKDGRLEDSLYDEFIENFVRGIRSKFPHILVQWEDFSKQNAFTILDKYRYKILSFNDDIQGTGSMALAGTINALKLTDAELKDQKIVAYGAGAGGIGIARQIAVCIHLKYGLSKEQAMENIAILDSKGLVTAHRAVESYKKPFSTAKKTLSKWDVEDISHVTLLEVIKNFGATVLYGTSGRPGHFTPEILTAMAENTERPIIFPLSNPTSMTEATPQEIYKVTKGKAIVATGSPFEPFHYNGKKIVIGQGNNFFIFPGVGFGAIVSCADYISDAVFTEAAYALSDCTPQNLISRGTIFPLVTDIRDISAQIALVTANQIAEERKSSEFALEDITSVMWEPRYHPLLKTA
jgi:malate dehydrogenase (oxaloacetate-decarboxylating)